MELNLKVIGFKEPDNRSIVDVSIMAVISSNHEQNSRAIDQVGIMLIIYESNS